MLLYSQSDKVKIIIDIANQLKNFPTVNESTINLFMEQYTYYDEWKQISNKYIKTDVVMKGTILFEEIGRKIEYYLPIVKGEDPLFVMRKIE
jgi:hypothetical protein